MEASSSKPRPSASIPSCTEPELQLANSYERDLRGLEHRWSMNERTCKQPDDKSNASSKPGVNQARDVSTGTTVLKRLENHSAKLAEGLTIRSRSDLPCLRGIVDSAWLRARNFRISWLSLPASKEVGCRISLCPK
jgi:hypothetical protein